MMQLIHVLDVSDRIEALKYAYAFMKTDELLMKECVLLNTMPNDNKAPFVFPRDWSSVFYNENSLPNWEQFKNNHLQDKSLHLNCVAALDREDKNRFNLQIIENRILVAIYGPYKDEALKVYEQLENQKLYLN